MRVVRGSAVLLAGLSLCFGAARASAAPRSIPPASGCTNPADTSVGPTSGSDPGQVAAAYDIAPLWKQGFEGQGESVAVITPGDALVDSTFDALSECYGPYLRPIPHVVDGEAPEPGGEGIEDPMMVLTTAPRAQVYMFETGTQNAPAGINAYAGMFRAALNPANTGGHQVDAISISFGHCETSVTTQIPSIESALRLAASLGVPVFASAGDSGAAGCLGHPVDTSIVRHAPVGLEYPGSSPLITDVGGTMFKFGSVLPSLGFPAGGPFSELVWNKFSPGTTKEFASGGGRSQFFSLSDAPWERQVGITGSVEDKPDITFLGSGPKPFGFAGTSASSPLMAGAIATLDGYLHAKGAARLGMLNPTLYRIGADPSVYAKVFNDIRSGSNAILDSGCCTANHGYDLASGLGSLNIKAFGDALLAHPSLRVPWTTLTLQPATFPNAHVGVIATTNNTLHSAHLFLKIFSGDKQLITCTTSPCQVVLGTETTTARQFSAQAEVGPSGSRPNGPTAIVSRSTSFSLKLPLMPPGCPPGARTVRPGWATIAMCPVRLTP